MCKKTNTMSRLLQKMIITLSDIECIISPAIHQPHRWKLFRDFLRIRIKASLNRWFHFKTEHFLSFTINLIDYETFFAIFRQIFVRQAYYSNTKNSAPFIVDCGGNIGMSLLYWKYLYPDASIIVFEPSKDVLPILKKTIDQNNLKDVILVPNALGGNSGTATMHPRGAAASGNTLVSSIAKTARAKDLGDTYQVTVSKLSDYIQKPIDILKIDIEGSEDIVFQELAQSKTLPTVQEIVLEYHHDPEKGLQRLLTILSICKKNNFAVQIFNEDLVFAPQRNIELENMYSLSMRIVRKN